MKAPLVVGVDARTTACKAIAFELDGTPVAEGRRALALVSRGVDGWEQDAESWWTATLDALGELTTALGSDRERIRAMAIAHQRETFVMTDAAGAPLHPALVWMDARCKEAVARATPLSDFLIAELSGRHPPTSDEGRAALVAAARPLVSQIGAPPREPGYRQWAHRLAGGRTEGADSLSGGRP